MVDLEANTSAGFDQTKHGVIVRVIAVRVLTMQARVAYSAGVGSFFGSVSVIGAEAGTTR